MGPKLAPRVEPKVKEKSDKDPIFPTKDILYETTSPGKEIFDIEEEKSLQKDTDSNTVPLEISHIASEEDIPKVNSEVHQFSRPSLVVSTKNINSKSHVFLTP